MPAEDLAILRIESLAGIPLYKIRLFLTSLDYAYNYIYVAEMMLVTPLRDSMWRQVRDTEHYKRFGAWVPKKDRLILNSVELHSPGEWDFLGQLNPLETIRLYLRDRHERKKDKAYREPAEQRGMELDNKIKEAVLLSTQIDNARKMGATDSDLRPLLERFIRQPLAELDRFQDEGVIGKASIFRPKTGDRNQGQLLGTGSDHVPSGDSEDDK